MTHSLSKRICHSYRKYITIPLYKIFVIIPSHRKMKKATQKEWLNFDDAIALGDELKIESASIKLNQALLKYR